MRLCVLGWPAVILDDQQISEIRGPRQVELLALLAAARGETVRTELIEDELWGGRPVSDSTVRVNVARLRGWLVDQLGRDPISSSPLGYRIDLGAEELNAARYERSSAGVAAQRRRGQFTAAVRAADEADRLWRGRAFEGAVDLPSVEGERARLEALRVDTWQERAVSLIELGDFHRALDQIESMQKVQPYRESAYGLQLIALHRGDRRPEALRRYHQTVELFHEELGVGPGAALAGLADELLADSPNVAVGESYLREVAAPGEPGTSRRGLPPVLDAMVAPRGIAVPFAGRIEVVEALRTSLAAPGAMAVVEGAGGVGLSRLAAEVAQRVAEDGVDVLYATCTRTEGLGSAPIPDLLLEAIERLPPAVAADWAPAVAAIAPVMSETGPSPGEATVEAGVDAETRRLQLIATAHQLMARATGAPTLVVIDDLQWIGPSGERFLRHLVEHLPAVRWLFLARPAGRTGAAVSFLGALGRRHADWVELGPLSGGEVRELVAAVAGPADVESWHETVMARSAGIPFVVQALLRHLVAGGDPLRLPRGVEHVVLADVARLRPETQVVAELMAVAGDGATIEVLADAAAISRRRASDACQELLGAGLVGGGARPGDAPSNGAAQVAFAHDLIAETLLAHLTDEQLAAHHLALGRAFVGAGGSEVRALSHLLAGGDDVTVAELDAVAGGALRLLNLQTAFERARDLGDAYLARVGDEAVSTPGLEARVQVATALLAMGETSRGLAVHEDLLPRVRASDDVRMLTDLVLARGPVDTGGADPLDRAREAQVLIELLPPEERSRRIQLACWAAHNLLVVGSPDEARELLVAARRDVDDRSDPDQPPVGPAVRGIVAGVAYQATTTADADPVESQVAYDHLVDLATETGLTSVTATRRLFAVDQAARFGGLADLRAAVDEMAEHLDEFPRPDLRWWVVAAEAALAHVTGDLAAADRELVRAATLGEQLSVAPSGPVSLLQRLMVQWELGTLGAMLPVFGQEPRPDAPAVELAMSAVVCVEAGDLAGAARAGRRLAALPRFLLEAGPSWPAVATIATRTAVFADVPELAEQVVAGLVRHEGTNLSVTGLAHFGPCGRLLGLLDGVQGDLDRAIDRVDAAHQDSREKDLVMWVAHCAQNAADLRIQRDRRGDAAEASRLRAERETIRTRFTLPAT